MGQGIGEEAGGGSTRVAMTPRDGTRRMAVLEKWVGRKEEGEGTSRRFVV